MFYRQVNNLPIQLKKECEKDFNDGYYYITKTSEVICFSKQLNYPLLNVDFEMYLNKSHNIELFFAFFNGKLMYILDDFGRKFAESSTKIMAETFNLRK